MCVTSTLRNNMELCKFSKILEYNFSLFMALFHKSCCVIQSFIRWLRMPLLSHLSTSLWEGRNNYREEGEEGRLSEQTLILIFHFGFNIDVGHLSWDCLSSHTTFLREGGWPSLCSGSFFSLQVLKYFLITCKQKYDLFISHHLLFATH